jgi:hypothetical protein
MLCRAALAICGNSGTKRTNTLRGQGAVSFNSLKRTLLIVTTRVERVKLCLKYL